MQIDHQIGRGILHLGEHKHRANKLISGERFNLIIWLSRAEFAGGDFYYWYLDHLSKLPEQMPTVYIQDSTS